MVLLLQSSVDILLSNTAQFVQALANPWYLNHLASQKYLDDPCFIAYINYLSYFAQPEYAKFLAYPSHALRALDLLQQPTFRKDILMPQTVARMIEAGMTGSSQDS